MLKPRHPYNLYQEINRELGKVWHIGQSHLYAHMKQLTRKELLVVQTETQSNRPARNVYAITAAGQTIFLDWLHQPTQHGRHFRLEFPARLYLFRRLQLPGLDHLIAAQTALFSERVLSLKQARQETQDSYYKLVLEFRQCEMSAIIDWLDHIKSGSMI